MPDQPLRQAHPSSPVQHRFADFRSKFANFRPKFRRGVIDTLKNPYDTLDRPARALKILLQMIVGIVLVYSVGTQFIEAIRSSQTLLDIWEINDVELLKSIGNALLIVTAIELGYMLFTDGPDEVINPPLIGIAALVLLRLPVKPEEASLERAIEVAIYVLILALLLLVRARFYARESERQKSARTEDES